MCLCLSVSIFICHLALILVWIGVLVCLGKGNFAQVCQHMKRLDFSGKTGFYQHIAFALERDLKSSKQCFHRWPTKTLMPPCRNTTSCPQTLSSKLDSVTYNSCFQGWKSGQGYTSYPKCSDKTDSVDNKSRNKAKDDVLRRGQIDLPKGECCPKEKIRSEP